jgi:hypothetical protein
LQNGDWASSQTLTYDISGLNRAQNQEIDDENEHESTIEDGLADLKAVRMRRMVLGPGGTYDSSPAIYRLVRKREARVPGGTPEYPRSCPSRRSAFAKLDCFSHEISIVPPGREFLNTSTGDKSPAYFLVVPPGHTATALTAEM